MEVPIVDLGLLLLVAAVVAIAARQLRMPYSVGLVLAGGGLALAHIAPAITLTKELLFVGLLPPLIFEAALYIEWRELRRDLWVILVLATFGVGISAAVTTLGMHYIAGWPIGAALVFGALIAATDPVSVIAAFKDAKVTGRLKLLVEAESLFNDSTAAIFFGLALTFATSSGAAGLGASQFAITLLKTVAGGLAVGGFVGGATILLAGRTTDRVVELTFTAVAAYGSFLIAERFHVSGVLATLTAGLLIGNVGFLGAISAHGREAVHAFWEFFAFLANSLIFMLIGIRVAAENFRAAVIPAAIAIALVLVGRAAAIYGLSPLFARTTRRIDHRIQHVLFWGGLRGALALALALGLPEAAPLRGEIVTVTFAVVAFSVFVQGLTMTPLLRRTGAVPASR